MLASQFEVDALILTRIAAFSPETKQPTGSVSEKVNAAANRLRYRIVEAGDSIVTSAAASPEPEMWVTVCILLSTAALVTNTPALVPTPSSCQRALTLFMKGSICYSLPGTQIPVRLVNAARSSSSASWSVKSGQSSSSPLSFTASQSPSRSRMGKPQRSPVSFHTVLHTLGRCSSCTVWQEGQRQPCLYCSYNSGGMVMFTCASGPVGVMWTVEVLRR